MGSNIKVIESDACKDNTKNHIDIKKAFLFNTHRIVQGKDFENFAINFLKPYFSEKFDESDDRNVSFNAEVQNVLGRPNAKNKN